MYECTFTKLESWKYVGQGKSLDEVISGMGMVIEGVRTTKAAHQLADQYDVSMPLTEALYTVLFENVPPKEAVDQLMNRMKKQEVEDLFGNR